MATTITLTAATGSTRYATVAQLKTYLGLSGSGEDSLLGDLLDRATTAIEQYTRRVFEAASDTTRYFDAVDDVEDRRLWFDREICQITTVTNGDSTTVSSDDYVTEPRNDAPYYALTLKSGSTVTWTYSDDAENAISVTGRWAYSTEPPADIVHATVRLAGFFYKQKDAQVFETTAQPDMGMITVPQSIPRDVRAILFPYRRRMYRR